MGELREAAVPEQIGTGVACVAQIGFAGAHQCAHRRGAHTGQSLFSDGLLEHKAVGAEQCFFQEGLFLAGQALGSILLLKAALNDITCALTGFPAAACTAHAVTHQQPCGITGQLSCAIIVLIILPDPADIRFSCKFHRILPLFYAFPFISSRRSWPQAALISLPRRRRTVALTPRLSSFCWKRRTLAASVAEYGLPSTGLMGIRFT